MVTEAPSTATQEIAGPRNGITVEKIEQLINSKTLTPVTSEGKSFNGKKQITIEGFDFTVDQDEEKQLHVVDCEEVTIQYCKFRKKTTKGQGLNITGSKTKKVTVQCCIFEDFSFTSDNGGEPHRLGNSQFSGCIFECVVKNNIFRNLKSDPECISIKSCKNIIEDNFFIGNESNVAVRHGGLTTIRHNYFKGTNGVRIHGFGNYVGYNCFEHNPASKDTNNDDLSPITLRWGKKEKDPNWDDLDKPSGKERQSHAEYAQTVNTTVMGNEFKNCKNTIIELRKRNELDLKPKDTKQENNKTVEKFTFETQGQL